MENPKNQSAPRSRKSRLEIVMAIGTIFAAVFAGWSARSAAETVEVSKLAFEETLERQSQSRAVQLLRDYLKFAFDNRNYAYGPNAEPNPYEMFADAAVSNLEAIYLEQLGDRGWTEPVKIHLRFHKDWVKQDVCEEAARAYAPEFITLVDEIVDGGCKAARELEQR